MLSSLFIGIKKKRGSLYLLLVPHIKALALPIEVERATQKPTPNMLIASPLTRRWQIYISHIGHQPLLHPWLPIEFARFQNVKNKASSKRLSLCHVFPAIHPPPFGSGLQPKNNCKYTHNFISNPIFVADFSPKSILNVILSISCGDMWQPGSHYSFVFYCSNSREWKRKAALPLF